MSLFQKKNDTLEKELQKAEGEAISSIIDKSMLITGEITFKGKAMIDGSINGNIHGEHLILSKSGRVTGDIHVTSFSCQGELQGNVKATMVIARKECAIRGKLEAGSLTVEPGALLDGEIKASTKELRFVDDDGKQMVSSPLPPPETKKTTASK
jgi:cytoskeletal protein CcmA (bactofilin family)